MGPTTIRTATKSDYDAIVSSLGSFWGERGADPIVRELHHALFVHEFGETAFVVEDGAGEIAAYLFGFLAKRDTLAYVHVIAVRDGCRHLGLARRLYDEFIRVAMARGARSLKAITTPTNHGSIAFHRALGMSATEVPDYAGPERSRVVLWRELTEP